jgi:collagen type III alpha
VVASDRDGWYTGAQPAAAARQDVKDVKEECVALLVAPAVGNRATHPAMGSRGRRAHAADMSGRSGWRRWKAAPGGWLLRPKERKPVISCPRCGLQNRPDAAVCPRCGTQLSQVPAYGAPFGAGVADGSMPTWLRPIAQPGGPPVGPQTPGAPPGYGQPPGLTPGSLVNEDALPAWLRAGDAGASPGAGQGGWGAAPPPGYGQYGQMPGPGGMWPQGGAAGAPNPFDESALPDWLRQGPNGDGATTTAQPPYGSTGPYNGYQGGYSAPGTTSNAFPPLGYPGASTGGSMGGMGAGNMNAGSLVDGRALPAWLNQPQGGPRAGGLSGGQGLDASSLIDETSLPQWLRAAGPGGAAHAGGWPGAAPEPMPAWLGQPGGMAPTPGQYAAPSGMPGGMQGGIPGGMPGATPGGWPGAAPAAAPAGPLVDESALPDWLRAQGAGGSGAQSQANRGGNSDWLTDARIPAQPGNGAPGTLLNNSELPPWLRGQQGGAPPGGQAPASGGAPGRGPALPLATAETPAWLRPDGSGGGAGQPPGSSSGRRRAGGAQRGERSDWSGSRVRGSRDGRGDARQYSAPYSAHQNGRGNGGGDEYGDSDGYDDEGHGEDEERPDGDWGDEGRRRRGFFGRFRRR